MTEYKPSSGGDYTLEAYNLAWKERFEKIRVTVQKTFGAKALQVEHVGSTAIEGMSAKPLIDVLVVVPNILDIEAEREQMRKLGHMYKENYLTENSLFLCKEVDGVRIDNIHVFPTGHPRIASFIDKRDYFMAHPDEVKRYEEVKRTLAERFPDDYRSYSRGKGDYLNRELIDKIRKCKNV